jgi:hypothetical protein
VHFKEDEMKKLIIVLLMVVLTGGLALAKDYEVKKKAGDFDVEVRIDKNPPVVGDNNISVEVKESGKAVTDAKIVVDYSMPAMPGMPAMNYKTDAECKGSVYKATMNLSMSGSWNIAVKITKAGKTSTAKFSIDAR